MGVIHVASTLHSIKGQCMPVSGLRCKRTVGASREVYISHISICTEQHTMQYQKTRKMCRGRWLTRHTQFEELQLFAGVSIRSARC